MVAGEQDGAVGVGVAVVVEQQAGLVGDGIVTLASGHDDGPKVQSLGLFGALINHAVDNDGEAVAWLPGFASRAT